MKPFNSAAAVQHKCGTKGRSARYVYVRGEGFITWQELERSVNEGARRFWNSRALKGVFMGESGFEGDSPFRRGTTA